MNKMDPFDKFVEDYDRDLDGRIFHCSYEILSEFVLQNNQFSKKEKKFVLYHLEACSECFAKYTQIFDHEFVSTDRLVLTSKYLQSDIHNMLLFNSQDKQIELSLSMDEKRLRAVFQKLPDRMAERNIILTISHLHEKIRISGAKAADEFYFHGNSEFALERIESIAVEIGENPEYQDKTGASRAPAISWLYAAAAVILVMLGSVVLIYTSHSPEPQITEKSLPQITDSVAANIEKSKKEEISSKKTGVEQPNKQSVKPKLLAENFVENPLLESFIDQNYRSANVVTDLSPKNGDTLRAPYTFRWTSESTGAIFKITVTDNRNKEVWQQSSTEPILLLNKILSPGLYYWTVLVYDKLFTVRKFYVLH